MAIGRTGAFIVIEGLDRSGKSTQAAVLHDHFESLGKKVQLLKFPDRTTAIGKMIDSYLRSESELDDRAIHLLFSANRWEAASTITSLLESGTTVLCDRYAFSGIAFSTAKGLPLEWCRTPDIGLPAPDLTLFLDISPEAAKERGGYGDERYEKEALQRKVRQVFGDIGVSMPLDKWVHLDAGRQRDIVSADIWENVKSLVEGGEHKPLERLWMS